MKSHLFGICKNKTHFKNWLKRGLETETRRSSTQSWEAEEMAWWLRPNTALAKLVS